MARVRAGDLRFRIDVYSSTSATYDNKGQISTATTQMFSTWADVRPLRGAEINFAQQMRGDATHMVTMRWTTSFGQLNHKHWFVTAQDSRRFDIIAALNVAERKQQYECLCAERV